MDIVKNEYGTWDIILADGTRFRLRPASLGFQVTAFEGGLTIRPQASNVIEVEGVRW